MSGCKSPRELRIRELADHVLRLHDENRRLREDAERYLWIRDECEPWRISKWLTRWRYEGESLDRKIDAWRTKISDAKKERTKKAPTDPETKDSLTRN